MNATEKATREAVARTQAEAEIQTAKDNVVRAKTAKVVWESQGAGHDEAIQEAEAKLQAVLEKHGLVKRAEIEGEEE